MQWLLVFSAILGPAIGARLPHIIGGHDVTTPGKWPWQASLRHYHYHFCGASLISRRWLVTAAHCVGAPVNQYSIIMGHVDESRTVGKPQTFPVSKIVIHPDHNPKIGGLPYDIALLDMGIYVDLDSNAYIRPIALPDKEEYFTGNPDCWITGWGHTKKNTNFLQEARVDVHSKAYCNSIYQNQGDFHVCVGTKGENSACFGDSGGPLSCRVNGVWKLVGASSWVMGDGRGGCDVNFPSTYARVAHVTDWIKEHADV